MSDVEYGELKGIITRIEKNFDAMIENLAKTADKFSTVCEEVVAIKTRFNEHEKKHESEKKWNEEFEDRLAKRQQRMTLWLGLVISIVSVISGILIKLL